MASVKDRRTGFSRRRQYGLFFGQVLAVVGAVVGVALLALSRFDPPAFAALRMAAQTPVAPVSSALNAMVDGVAGIPAGIGDTVERMPAPQGSRPTGVGHDLLKMAERLGPV